VNINVMDELIWLLPDLGGMASNGAAFCTAAIAAWSGSSVSAAGAPPILLSGNHAKIESYRQEQALVLTYQQRSRLLSKDRLRLVEQILKQRRQEEHDASP
jgi:hypothetical protein